MNTILSQDPKTSLLLVGATILIGIALGGTFRALSLIPTLPGASGGYGAKKRAEALRGGAFRAFDPVLRFGGAVMGQVFLAMRRRGGRLASLESQLAATQKKQLLWAGQPAGWDSRQLSALSIFSASLGAGLGAVMGVSSDSGIWIAPFALVGLAFPTLRLQSLRQQRFVEMSRDLPAAIDLMAMAMGAGSDFVAATRSVVEGQDGVVADELGQVLGALDLGITRASALVGLRERIPTADVRDLVRAVLLAERKGTPLSDVLNQQARLSRQRRSERAEEAAARAAVLMLFPMMLLMVAVMILIVGPMFSIGGGL